MKQGTGQIGNDYYSIAYDDLRCMHGHNLKQIYDRIHEQMPDFILDRHALASLKDYYYDTKYPGDNFVNVTREECNDNLQTAYAAVQEVNRFRLENGLKIQQFDQKLCGPDTVKGWDAPYTDAGRNLREDGEDHEM